MKAILLLFMFGLALPADDLEKTQKKQLESQVLIEMKNVTDAIKRLDEQIHKRVKDNLTESRKLYESRKYKEAAIALDEGMKLQAFQSVLAYNLALCYYQLSERTQALEYLAKAKAGTVDPKQRQKLLQLVAIFTTGENGLSVNDSDKDRISRVNRLSESIGVEASLEDAGGEEDPLPEDD